MSRILVEILFVGLLFSCNSCSEKVYYLQKQKIQLSTPKIESDAFFFAEELNVELIFGLDEAQIYYTLDGSEPTAKSRLYSDKITLTESTQIKACVMHQDYLTSEVISAEFIQTNPSISIVDIKLNRELNENYLGTGFKTLIDGVKGTKDFRGKEWLGFAGGDLEIKLNCKGNKQVREVIISLLSEQKSWIFLPEKIQVYTSKDGKTYTLTAVEEVELTRENSDSEFRFIRAVFPSHNTDFVKVIIKNIEEIPAWHPGKGTPSWLFIDEVLLK